MRSGGWTEVDPAWMLGTEVTGKTVGVVGFGRIGQAFARRARGFDLRVLYSSPRDAGVHVGASASRSNGSSPRATSSPCTSRSPPRSRNLLSRERIALLRPGRDRREHRARRRARRRGPRRGAREGRVGGAGLDVFPDEPRVPEAYLRLENVVLTPHLGSGTRETRAAMARRVLEDAARVARGEPPRYPVS